VYKRQLHGKSKRRLAVSVGKKDSCPNSIHIITMRILQIFTKVTLKSSHTCV